MIRQSIAMLSPYAERLNELLTIDQSTDLVNLAPAPQEQTLFALFKRHVPRLNPDGLAKKIEDWTSYLIDEWMHNKRSVKKIEKIRCVAMKIKTEQKITIIKEKLLQMNIHWERLTSSLRQLEHRIEMILETPKAAAIPQNQLAFRGEQQAQLFDYSSSPPDSGDFLISRSFSETDLSRPVLNSHYERRLQRHIDAQILTKSVEKEHREKEKTKIKALFDGLQNAEPIEKLKAYATLKNPNEWLAFSSFIPDQQIVSILGAALNDQDYHHYIPRLLLFLNYGTLEKVLLGSSQAQLKMMNYLFQQSPDLKEEWFFKQYQLQREYFPAQSNQSGEDIDIQDERMRKIQKILLRFEHNDEMDEVVNKINHRYAVFKAYKQLIGGVFRDQVTIELLVGTKDQLSEVDKTYVKHLRRMSQLKKDYDQEEGCPYKYLHGKVLIEEHLDDDEEEAGEIFTSFRIENIEHYQEVGLITEIPELIRREWSLNPSNGHRMAAYFALEELCRLKGIKKCDISMWKELRVWNRDMLKELLNQPEMKPHFRYANLSKRLQKKKELQVPTPRVEEID